MIWKCSLSSFGNMVLHILTFLRDFNCQQFVFKSSAKDTAPKKKKIEIRILELSLFISHSLLLSMTTQTGVWLPNLWSEVLPIRTLNSVLGGNRKTDHHQIQHCFSRKQSHALPCLESTLGAHNAKHVITKFRSNSALCFPTGNLCA